MKALSYFYNKQNEKHLNEKTMVTLNFQIRDREAGNSIESFDTLAEAKEVLAEYENDDIAEGTFTEDFYEIYDVKNESSI